MGGRYNDSTLLSAEDVKAEVEPEPDSESRVCVEARERSESCTERFDSMTVDAGLSMAGEDQPFMESRQSRHSAETDHLEV